MASAQFASRHIGPNGSDLAHMLNTIGVGSINELIDMALPSSIRLPNPPAVGEAMSEYACLQWLRQLSEKNRIFRTYIGMGYYNTITPSVIVRNILENPSWYTSYTPYQAEVSQGRLEALLNFQTMVSDLTGLEVANASLLDEAQAAAEAMLMMFHARSRPLVKRGANVLFVDEHLFPQTLDVLMTRATPAGIEIRMGDYAGFEPENDIFGAIVQFPNAEGALSDYRDFARKLHENDQLLAVGTDLLPLTLLSPPGEWGADIAFGSCQRFGLPMAYGGPHAAFFACREAFKRDMPGRIIGISVDARGQKALRMALQTREQHIKREKATSNICTSQALLAIMAGMYAVYHGAEGLTAIARTLHNHTCTLASALRRLGCSVGPDAFFDTLKIALPASVSPETLRNEALARGINFRYFVSGHIGISLDETVGEAELAAIIALFEAVPGISVASETSDSPAEWPGDRVRTSPFLTHRVFSENRSETVMMRYIKKLERKDISLTHSMIPLGSCTMKLNAASEMLPITWPGFAALHPFVPSEQAEGYRQLIAELEKSLARLTGFDAVSLQPNSGAAGEYAGLLVIREYLERRGEGARNIALIPSSAHGTNPASAVMAGMKTVTVPCTERGDIDVEALKSLAEQYAPQLAVFMITYPSTHGVFEERIREMISIVHQNGGLVYMDGANMNAQTGLTSPGFLGADVCHLNLHKTFASPHGGGGPGVGPICVTSRLAPYLPTHCEVATGGSEGITAVSAAPYGSAGILSIALAYIKMMGEEGLAEATRYAILNANYLAARLKDKYNLLYTNTEGFVAHEMILDCRPLKSSSGITEGDIAKRLMDYGFHAPTLSFPVHGTLMVEPTESESLAELDRFAEALLSIHAEIDEVAGGAQPVDDNVLKNAPHCEAEVVSDNWSHPYGRERAAYPLAWIRENKFWPGSARVDDASGDRNLICTCK
ncbi:MAG: aminomethyl-transferring glycine dehydrogenase [Bacteroidales bacterium]